MPHSPSSVYLLCNPATEIEAGVSDADYDVSDAGVNHSEVSDAEGPSQNMSRPFEGDENSSGVAVKWTVFVLTVIICSGLTGDSLFFALKSELQLKYYLSVAKLASAGTVILMQKDWIVVISNGNNDRLAGKKCT